MLAGGEIADSQDSHGWTRQPSLLMWFQGLFHLSVWLVCASFPAWQSLGNQNAYTVVQGFKKSRQKLYPLWWPILRSLIVSLPPESESLTRFRGKEHRPPPSQQEEYHSPVMRRAYQRGEIAVAIFTKCSRTHIYPFYSLLGFVLFKLLLSLGITLPILWSPTHSSRPSLNVPSSVT